MTVDIESWTPRTKIGLLVKEGKITSIDELFSMNIKIREPEIVDILLPDLEEQVIYDAIQFVQKQTREGEKTKIKVPVVVGNRNGYVGVGAGKARQIRDAIAKAIEEAKLNIIPVLRGCGSWECRCGLPHSVPTRVEGKCGSVRVILMPAPSGVGLVAGEPAKIVLRMAGIKDVWSKTFGNTRTTLNFLKATYNALKKTITLPVKKF